ncbi:hypothetical protein JCM12296A_07090 [Desulfosarcina cetonica]
MIPIPQRLRKERTQSSGVSPPVAPLSMERIITACSAPVRRAPTLGDVTIIAHNASVDTDTTIIETRF